MLTFFHFEKLTFESDVLGQNIICDSLTEHWRNYGCLILSKEALSNIKVYIDCYPQKSKEKWRVGFSHYKTIEVNNPEIALEQKTETDDLIRKLTEINVNSLLHNQSGKELPTIDNKK